MPNDSDTIRAFLWKNGVMVDLNTLVSFPFHSVVESALDINDAGQILCEIRWRDAPLPLSGNWHRASYLLTPR